ncbi:MAG: TRAP transporter large permease subunit [Paracoccus sp. (in: a-proteobacteria)]|nr:TRAP transporter large permease subunit [Paracoccus sp. (in: a-proteobacteria)]
MIELIAHNLAPIMFFSMVLFLLFGYPISFALAANGLLFFFIGVELAPISGGQISLNWNLLQALPERIWGIMRNELFLAIPFFTFMGIVLERSGMAEDLLDTIGQLFGPIRGGLAYAVVIVGALLAATTGVVAASVIAMGLISLPIMLRYNYDRGLATGVIAASGTLAQIIPPSLVLIVLAEQVGQSVGNMYRGALIPALTLTGIYLVYIFVLSIIRPNSMPALPPEARGLGRGGPSLLIMTLVALGSFYASKLWLAQQGVHQSGIWAAVIAILVPMVVAMLDRLLRLNLLSVMTRQVIMVMIPPLALVFLVLGTIFLGIAAPTEGGAMGAVGAIVLAAMKGRLNFSVVQQALESTTRLSSFVMFILIGATVFSLTFYGVNGQIWVKDLLLALPGGELGFLIVVSVIIFFLAFFLDFFELAFVIVPLLVPTARELGIDMVWFGVVLGVVMQTSFLTPPVGFALFYLRSVAARQDYVDPVTQKLIPRVSTIQIYKGAAPFVGLQIIAIGLVIAFPQMVMRYKAPPPPPPAATAPSQAPSAPAPGGGGYGGFGGFGAPAPSGGAPANGGTGGPAAQPAPAAPGAFGSYGGFTPPQPAAEPSAPEAPAPAAPSTGPGGYGGFGGFGAPAPSGN